MFKRFFTDGQLADYLRKKGVSTSWVAIESPAINEYWKGEELIAIVVFDNATLKHAIYTCDME